MLDIVHEHRFDPDASPLEHLTYLLFGEGEERFAAHLVTRPPDFDHLLSVDVAGERLTDAQLRRGIELTFADRANEPGQRLGEGERVRAVAVVDGERVPIDVEGVRELYFETHDLEASM